MGSRFLLVLTLLVVSPAIAADCRESLPKIVESVPSAADPVPHIFRDGQYLGVARKLSGGQRKKAIAEYGHVLESPPLAKGLAVVGMISAGIITPTVIEALMREPSLLPFAALAVVPALYAADFTSAVLHKFWDGLASERSRLWGTTTRRFRIHHEVPNAMIEGNYISNLGDTSTVFGPMLAATALGNYFGYLDPVWTTALGTYFLAGMHTTAIHRAAHMTKPAFPFRILQKLGLILGRKHHLEHHAPPFDKHFALVNGWSTPLFERLDLWHRLDREFWNYRGKMPHNWIQDPRSIPEDVMDKLKKESAVIPDELWAYSETAYPERVPADLKGPLQSVRKQWRQEFIAERRAIYRELAVQNPVEARRTWIEEQKELYWLYGKIEIPLL